MHFFLMTNQSIVRVRGGYLLQGGGCLTPPIQINKLGGFKLNYLIYV